MWRGRLLSSSGLCTNMASEFWLFLIKRASIPMANNKKKIVYYGNMDPECVSICDAINKIPGVHTIESCCGHSKYPFRVWFIVSNLKRLPGLLYYLDPCHVGFRWKCEAYTDCSMAPVRFMVESESVGKESYLEANIIAEKVISWLVSQSIK